MHLFKKLYQYTLAGTTTVSKGSTFIYEVGSIRRDSATNALTAFAGGGQTSAIALSGTVNRLTTVATAGDSAKLPTALAGMGIIVTNSAALGADIFPATGEAINGLGSNNALRLGANCQAFFVCTTNGTWNVQLPVRGAKYTKNTTAGATTAAAGDLTGIGVAYVQAEFSAVGAANLATRTATQMVADGALQVGDSYVLEITNTSGGTTTLTAGTGVTLTGTMTMATNTTRRFNVLVTAATTLTIQSTGVGTIS
jgi:hypothetical protein